jgi:hypothetical protein
MKALEKRTIGLLTPAIGGKRKALPDCGSRQGEVTTTGIER